MGGRYFLLTNGDAPRLYKGEEQHGQFTQKPAREF